MLNIYDLEKVLDELNIYIFDIKVFGKNKFFLILEVKQKAYDKDTAEMLAERKVREYLGENFKQYKPFTIDFGSLSIEGITIV